MGRVGATSANRKRTTYGSVKCRWAFDRNREVLDTLDGSSGVFRRFYIGPEGLIEGDAPKTYNLDAVQAVGLVRPGSFFFMNGRNLGTTNLHSENKHLWVICAQEKTPVVP